MKKGVRLAWFLMKARGLEGKEICENTGISRTSFSRWLNSEQKLSKEEVNMVRFELQKMQPLPSIIQDNFLLLTVFVEFEHFEALAEKIAREIMYPRP